MESFLNKVEREANLEVQRIRTEAQQIVDVLKALQLEVPQELQHIVSPLHHVPAVSVEEVTEKERGTFVKDVVARKKGEKQDHSERIAKVKAKAEAEYQQARSDIREALSKGPKPAQELFNELPYSKYRIQTTGSRMKKNGEIGFRTDEFQGASKWFLVERPVSLETLRDNVVDRKGGDIPLVQTQVKLGFQFPEDLTKMLDELVKQGIIRFDVENDTYKNYESSSSSDLRTLHEKKKYSGGNGVAGTGRSEVTSNSEVRKYTNKIKAQGGIVKLTGGDHIRIEYGGKSITVGKSPSKSGILQDKNRVKSVLGLNV